MYGIDQHAATGCCCRLNATAVTRMPRYRLVFRSARQMRPTPRMAAGWVGVLRDLYLFQMEVLCRVP